MRIIKLNNQKQSQIEETITTLKSNGLVVFPTDTVYGLLADARNSSAVSKLLSFKERKPGQAISVFVANKKMAQKYVEFNQNTENVVNNLLPGPFTVIAKAKKIKSQKEKIDSRLLAENGTLGFRIPNYPLILELVEKYGCPLTATSANLSGKPPHYSIQSFLKSLPTKKRELIDLIVDAGKLPPNKPSTVIDTTTGQLKTLRIGDLLPKKPNSLISKSEAETKQLGRFLATKFLKNCLSKPIVFLLKGELGAGKTIFTKGFGETLKIKEEIISPTFVISYEYKSPFPFQKLLKMYNFDIDNTDQNISKNKQVCLKKGVKLLHFDLYRIESLEELSEIGFFDNLTCGNFYVVEWPERLSAEIIDKLKNFAEIIIVNIKYLSSTQREIEWSIYAK